MLLGSEIKQVFQITLDDFSPSKRKINWVWEKIVI